MSSNPEGPLRLEKRSDGVVVLWFDAPGRVNLLTPRLLGTFKSMLDRIGYDPEVRGVVIASGKDDGFIAGADLRLVREMTAKSAEAFSREAHALCDSIAESHRPFVAAIHGAALGGGFELALACHGRVATIDPRTILGLPEVRVGLMPAAGGTQRLPALIGLDRALPLLLSGRHVRAHEAREAGMVDAIGPVNGLIDRAAELAIALADDATEHDRTAELRNRAVALPIVRNMVLRQAKKQVDRRTRDNYPAPHAILSAVRVGLADGFRRGQEEEIRQFGRLVETAAARNLIWIFEGSRATRKPPEDAADVGVIGVIGAGVMGEGIAAASLRASRVLLRDTSHEVLARAENSIEEDLRRRMERGALTERQRQERSSNLTLTTGLEALSKADLVIEAVPEDLTLKRRILAECEGVMREDAIWASNTSAIPITTIAARARHPERVVGMHYFSPVAKMPLVEIVATERASPAAIATARAFAIRQGKSVVVVRDGPGFYTTRILSPALNEALRLLEEGHAIETIDEVMKDFGFPVGPITLLDEVGIDVAAHVAEVMGKAFASRIGEPPAPLRALAREKYLGRKNGRGFYHYPREEGAKKEVNVEVYRLLGGSRRKTTGDDRVADRIVLPIVAEAIRCLEESIIDSPFDGDLAAVLGVGFPPFRGGPFHFVDSEGAGDLVERMKRFESELGSRFSPPVLLLEHARSGARFFEGRK